MKTPPDAPWKDLEPSPDALQRMTAEAMERIAAHIASLPSSASADVEGAAALAAALAEPSPPERGAPLRDLLDLRFDRAVPQSFNTAGPGYLAYIPARGLVDRALAGLDA